MLLFTSYLRKIVNKVAFFIIFFRVEVAIYLQVTSDILFFKWFLLGSFYNLKFWNNDFTIILEPGVYNSNFMYLSDAGFQAYIYIFSSLLLIWRTCFVGWPLFLHWYTLQLWTVYGFFSSSFDCLFSITEHGGFILLVMKC